MMDSSPIAARQGENDAALELTFRLWEDALIFVQLTKSLFRQEENLYHTRAFSACAGSRFVWRRLSLAMTEFGRQSPSGPGPRLRPHLSLLFETARLHDVVRAIIEFR